MAEVRSKDKQAQAIGGGISFSGLLTLLFIALKLTNYITWSWVWILSPLWIPASLIVAVIAIIIVGAIILVAFDA